MLSGNVQKDSITSIIQFCASIEVQNDEGSDRTGRKQSSLISATG